MEKEVRKLLRELGVVRIYRGYYAVVLFVELVIEDENRLLNVTETYKEIAAENGAKWTSVERNIRTIVDRAWRRNPKRLVEVAGYPMEFAPTVSEFLEIVYNHVSRQCITK